ncbi:S53 family peptidase [Streptomyces sp. RB6PN25]|uniref:S53 family peptidase n=1 Tax=Streptomyces humicola TaxID=2953240 RepID=A0ABT1PWA0_9ACTN|nr:S53 family peptidase [Streptomyces humicola]MCQ4081947.1 S53 family peptidase [Streptomyces humicola]
MKRSRSRTRAGLAAAATLPLVAGALALGIPNAQADAHPRQALANTKPQWATAQADKGAAPASTAVDARVYLAGRNAKGLAAYAQAVSDPHSASYGKYLTPQQAQARFGVTKQQTDEVTSWLKSAGLTVTGVNEHYISVSGDQAAVEKAFNTQLHNYTKGGHVYHAPSSTPSVPASLGGAVLTVTGLDNAPQQVRHDDTLPPPSAVFKNSGPYSTYYGSTIAKNLPSAFGGKAPYVIKGYTGKDLRAAYGAGKWTGKGVTVAITDAYASPTIAQDASEYAARNGDASYKPGQLTQVLPSAYNSVSQCQAAGWYGEETLDVEAVHAVAPGAGITYVGSASCNDNDLIDALTKVVDNHLADIVSNSWGDVESNETPDIAAAYDQVFQQGAVEGIGFYFSSGDDGDNVAATGTKQADTPGNSPWATSVGGTSLALGKNDTYEWETGWGTQKSLLSKDGTSWTGFPGPFTSGAGGGTSTMYAQPFYQRGVVPDALSKANGATAMRVQPDIAAVADPNTGFLVGQTQTDPDGKQRYSEYRIGGTSLAAPTIAAIQADAQQAQHGVPIGFANPAIYERYGTPAYHDVTDHPLGQGQGIAEVRVDYANGYDAAGGLITSLRTLGTDSSLHATVGYDDVTGVGSPGAGYVTSYARR